MSDIGSGSQNDDNVALHMSMGLCAALFHATFEFKSDQMNERMSYLYLCIITVKIFMDRMNYHQQQAFSLDIAY